MGTPRIVVTTILMMSSIAFAGDDLNFQDLVPANTEAAVDAPEISDILGEVASDGDTFVAVWTLTNLDTSDDDVMFSRSTDGGKTWSPQQGLNPWGFTHGDNEPTVAVNGEGVWMALWRSTTDIEGSGQDFDIAGAISTDGGITWTNPFFANDDAFTDSNSEVTPHLAGGPNGTWIAVWEQSNSGSVVASRSIDDGATWSPPSPLPFRSNDETPRVATRGGGVWIVVLAGIGGAGFNDVGYSRSVDDGVNWVEPDTLNVPIVAPFLSHVEPDIAFDNDGNAIAVWLARANSDDGALQTYDPYFSVSEDGGLTWTDQQPLYADPLALRSTSTQPRVATDGEDNWVVNWSTTKVFDEQFGGDTDIWFTCSVNDGEVWSDPQVVLSSASIDGTLRDFANAMVSDKRGTWLSAWTQTDSDFGSPPNFVDRDVFASTGYFTGYLRGRVTDADTGDPVGSASLRIRNALLGVERIAVTDRLGQYRVANVPEGTYEVEVWGADTTGDLASAFDTAQTTVQRGAVTKLDFDLTFDPLVEGVWGTVFGEVTPGSSINRVPLVGVRIESYAPIGPGGSEVLVNVTYSAGDGTYTVANATGAKGTGTQVRVNFDALGFVNDDRTPTVPPGDNAESNPTLEQKNIGFPGALTGEVTRSDTNAVVTGALIEIDGPVRAARESDIATGIYTFDALPASTYTARVSKTGFITKQLNVNIPGDGLSILDIELDADEGQVENSLDIDGDGQVNAVDVQLVINAVLGLNLGGLDADVNGDNARNSIDIQQVINTVLGI